MKSMQSISAKKILLFIFLLFLTPHVLADNFKWVAMKEFPPGAQMTVINGDPDQKGPFTLRLKLPSNYIVPAHSHSVAAHATVISGTYYIGTGPVADANIGKPLNAGDSFTISAHDKHYGWTKDGTILQIEATGPWDTTYSANG
jgi:quercetin dioxygenase-like cupin family protein